jgi:hypothetical protein
MNITILGRVASSRAVPLAVIGLVVCAPTVAQSQPQTRADGVIHHYTAELDPGGPWQIVGEWSLTLNTASGRVDFLAALSMVRSDNPSRGAHTHHVSMTDGQVTNLANGHRISGTATITSNGSLAGFSGSPVDIEISGGSGLPFANVKVTFGGPAAAHFGAEPVHGVVSAGR